MNKYIVAERDELRKEVAELRSELTSAKSYSERLFDEKVDLIQENYNINKAMSLREAALTRARNEVKGLAQELNQLKEEHQQLTVDFCNLLGKYSASLATIEGAERRETILETGRRARRMKDSLEHYMYQEVIEHMAKRDLEEVNLDRITVGFIFRKDLFTIILDIEAEMKKLRGLTDA